MKVAISSCERRPFWIKCSTFFVAQDRFGRRAVIADHGTHGRTWLTLITMFSGFIKAREKEENGGKNEGGKGSQDTDEKLEKRSRTDEREREPNETKRKDWRKTGKSEPREKAGHVKKKWRKQRRNNRTGERRNKKKPEAGQRETEEKQTQNTENESKKKKRRDWKQEQGTNKPRNRGRTSKEPEKNREKGTNISRGKPPWPEPLLLLPSLYPEPGK